MTEIADRLTELAPDVDHAGARRYFDRSRVSRRRRQRVGSAAAFVVVASVAALAMASLTSTRDEASVTSTGGDLVGVEFPHLDGGVVEVQLPRSLAQGFEIEAQTATLSLGSTGWRLDVERAGAARPESPSCDPPPDVISDVIGAWRVAFSGDGMTDLSCRVLVGEFGSFTMRNGTLVYDGSGALGPIDGPDVFGVSDAARFSLFHRSPSCAQADSVATRSGLVVERIDDPARGSTLTVLCDDDASLELWIDAPERPSEEQLDAIQIGPSTGT